MSDSNVSSSFEAFFQGWMERQRNYLEELVSARQCIHELQDSERKELINRVLSHYEQYFEEKSKVAHQDVLLVFSPPWFSTLEKTYLWVSGFKPATAFHVVNENVLDLSEEQRQRLSHLSQETKLKERNLNDEMAKVQESVAAPPLVGMARSHGRLCLSGSFMAGEGAVPSEFKVALENLVSEADALRTEVALEVLQILRSDQGITFLAAMADLHLKIRTWGLENDAQCGGDQV